MRSPILKYKTVTAGDDEEALRVLKILIHYQIVHVPFEDLELHYSSHHNIRIDPNHLFNKIVERRCGRGGYCMENTTLFVTVLRSLGYDVMNTGARVNSSIHTDTHRKTPTYGGWDHMVAIVAIGGKRYLIDVGFGGNSLTFPVPLENGYIGLNARPNNRIQLALVQVPPQMQSKSKKKQQPLWVYSVQTTVDGPWVPGYCFSETEFFPKDFEVMNFWTSKNPKSWFTRHIMCVKFIMDKENEEIIGKIVLLDREIKEIRNGTLRRVEKFTSEDDRIEAMEKYLRIRLSSKEKCGITDMATMIA